MDAPLFIIGLVRTRRNCLTCFLGDNWYEDVHTQCGKYIVAEVTFNFWAIFDNLFTILGNFGHFWTIVGYFNIIVQDYLSNHIFHTVTQLFINERDMTCGLNSLSYFKGNSYFPIEISRKTDEILF